jgi:predicted transcriptional regulator
MRVKMDRIIAVIRSRVVLLFIVASKLKIGGVLAVLRSYREDSPISASRQVAPSGRVVRMR